MRTKTDAITNVVTQADMQAGLKRLHSPDVLDLRNYHPDPADCFGFLLQAMIGPLGEDWEESFDIVVCTPEWLKRRYPKDIILGEHRLIVPHFDYAALERFISNFAHRCSGTTWQEVAQKLSRPGKWEFEDYREAPQPSWYQDAVNNSPAGILFQVSLGWGTTTRMRA